METETKAEEKTEELKEAERPEIVLMAKIGNDGQLSWTIPQDLRLAMYLNKHLDIIISKMHEERLSATIRQQNEIRKPNIITSIKNSKVMRGIFR